MATGLQCCTRGGAGEKWMSYEESLAKVVEQLQGAHRVMVLSGAGMSTAAGIPDFRSPGGLYGSSAALLERFTFLGDDKSATWQKQMLKADVKNALTLRFLSVNPLPYHEMRRGMIIGLGENQWKLTIGHVFPEILNRNGKLHMLASQNIDGLDHKVVSDKRKLYNPHGLMSALQSEPLDDLLCAECRDPLYQRYVELVKRNIKDIYADRPARQGRSSHLWPGPEESTPITLAMFGSLLPEKFKEARAAEVDKGVYSVKPGSVLFDRTLWRTNGAGEPYNAFQDVKSCDMLLVMGTSLSGLTIDQLAYDVKTRTPRVVFDMTTAPVESIKGNGHWASDTDSLLQGPIDKSILDILQRIGWLDQLAEYLPHLCLASLKLLKQFLADTGLCVDDVGKVDLAIEAEIERERSFYGDE